MSKDFSYYLSKFLREYLVVERNMSDKTIKSYKKTFSLLINYLVENKNMKLQDINFRTVTREIIIDFLNYLENDRHNSVRTRNQRLAAIKSFYQFTSIDEIDNFDNIKKILSIKSKKYTKKVINYLTENELKRLFESIDTTTKIGRRDLTLLVLLYDTAARASEILNLKYEDINLEEKYLILDTKGKKKRMVPFMNQTKDLLIKYINEFNIKSGYLFNNKGKKYSKNFIDTIINKYQYLFKYKKISPHTFRHTRSIHLLDKGVNIVYIQEFLGHEQIITTQEYVKVIEKSKFEAIERVTPKLIDEKLEDWNNDKELLSLLLNL